MKDYLKQVTLLYVEDDDDVREGYQRTLTKISKQLFLAKDGEEGLKIYKQHTPDIIISDINMPKKNGIEMVKEIKEIDENQTIVFTTAHMESKYTLQALDMQVDGYFVKPINKKALNKKLQKVAKNIIIEKEEKQTREILQKILDNQTSITILTDFETIKFASKSFYKLFNINNNEEFFDKFDNILDIFVKHDKYLYGNDKNEFLNHYSKATDEHRVVSIPSVIAEVKAYYIEIDKLENLYILTLTDITDIQIERLNTLYLANHDKLTSVYNRAKFEELFDIKFKEYKRYKKELSLAILDIDHFKKINDTYGHQTGDKILKVLAKICTSSIRESDLFARWGGEEFVILMSETDIDQAKYICEKLRVKIENSTFPNNIKLTVSFGVSNLKKEDTKEKFFKKADEALYRAKSRGRNKVVAYE